ncbi:transglycosylase SLT domain-containing protein, partial [Ferrovibrio sp.]|uniref:transglycosylase SLT domain-containing protein n=1 Tax=Ferrovibrio sp. TaxID=1917215 RepID=UPI0025C541DC
EGRAMVRALAIMALAAVAWVMMTRRATAAVTVTEPGPMNSVLTGPAAYLAIVRRLNADEFGGFFDPALIMGMIATESSYRPNAYRYEARLGEASYGLMQVLESTARDRGMVGSPEQMYDPEIGIRFGMRQLKWSYDYLAARIGPPSREQLLSAYNAGVGYVVKGGARIDYAAKVELYMADWVGYA